MKYDDIIYYNYTGSKRKNKMSLEDRAARFAPFQSLEGYVDYVRETERLTKAQKYLDENEIEVLNNKIKYIYDNNVKAEYTYFVKDKRKDGGSFKKINDYIKKIDIINSKIYFKNNEYLNFEDIVDVKVNDN